MNSAIVVIKISDADLDGTNKQWQGFLGVLNEAGSAKPRHINKEEGVTALADNVWFVDMAKNPNALARLLYHADKFQLRYGILQLSEQPKWIPEGLDLKKISA